MNYIIERIGFVAFLAVLNVGVVLLLYKWRIIEYYQLHRRAWMPTCNFCLFFWMAFAEAIKFITIDFVFSIQGIAWTVIFALFAAALSRKVL